MGQGVASITPPPAGKSTQREWVILLILSGSQFAHILDFVIMMPLGPQLMRVLEISPRKFGLLVSVYTLSAALSTFLGAFFIDRFDRRRALGGLMSGFATGTLLCAIAPSYWFLFAARAVAGGFGGLMGAVVFSIVGDVFREERRGAAMGTVMSAFSLASVLGVPFGLYLATHFTWQAPFFLLAVLSSLMAFTVFRAMPPIRSHMRGNTTHAAHAKQGIIAATREMIFTRHHMTAYALAVSLMFAAFSVIPFMSPFLVKNVGLTEAQLPYVYLSGGAFTLLTSRLIGRLADRFGKQRVFTFVATLSIPALLAITNLPRVHVWVAIVVTTAFTILIAGRAVPAMAMITGSVEARHRGSFMSFTTAIQNMASGLASLLAGTILAEGEHGQLLHYDVVGVIAVISTLISIALARRLRTFST